MYAVGYRKNMMEIVYRRTGLCWLYYLFVLTFVLLGLLLLVVAMGQAGDEGPWSGKWMSVVGWAVAGLSWLMGVPQMWSMAKSYGRNEVRLDGSRFALHTPAGTDLQFAFCDVRQVSWNGGLRSRLCTVETGTSSYQFDTRVCPRAGHVARLVAERSGRNLQIEKS